MNHNPGGRTRLRLAPDIIRSSADFSPCGRYRTTLWRGWGDLIEDEPFALWLAMNPSTADLTHNDPSVARMVSFTRREGLKSLCVTNVCDYRATNPRDLRAPGVIPCSDQNLSAISRNASVAERVIVAFGSLPKALRPHAERAVQIMRDQGITLWCLGHNSDGSPKHPLYVRSDAALERWWGWP